MLQAKNEEMVEQIFAATERLMAKYGLPHLSMHKIAKEAKISPGTIYIYFKSKEELLERLAHYVFERFSQCLGQDYDSESPFFAQYRQMWWNLWHLLHDNPDLTLNIYQYRSLPGFDEMFQAYRHAEHNTWRIFCANAKKAGILGEMPDDILFALSLDSAINLASKCIHPPQEFEPNLLESVLQRTWLAIQKNI